MLEADPGGQPMSAIRTTVTDGKIVLDAPADWPEGMEVVVSPAEETVGLTEEEWPETPEEIEAWLRWYDSLEPLILTPEDEARIAAARKAQKEFELATWHEQSEKLRKMWE
jgi:hypothetical protein